MPRTEVGKRQTVALKAARSPTVKRRGVAPRLSRSSKVGKHKFSCSVSRHSESQSHIQHPQGSELNDPVTSTMDVDSSGLYNPGWLARAEGAGGIEGGCSDGEELDLKPLCHERNHHAGELFDGDSQNPQVQQEMCGAEVSSGKETALGATGVDKRGLFEAVPPFPGVQGVKDLADITEVRPGGLFETCDATVGLGSERTTGTPGRTGNGQTSETPQPGGNPSALNFLSDMAEHPVVQPETSGLAMKLGEGGVVGALRGEDIRKPETQWAGKEAAVDGSDRIVLDSGPVLTQEPSWANVSTAAGPVGELNHGLDIEGGTTGPLDEEPALQTPQTPEGAEVQQGWSQCNPVGRGVKGAGDATNG